MWHQIMLKALPVPNRLDLSCIDMIFWDTNFTFLCWKSLDRSYQLLINVIQLTICLCSCLHLDYIKYFVLFSYVLLWCKLGINTVWSVILVLRCLCNSIRFKSKNGFSDIYFHCSYWLKIIYIIIFIRWLIYSLPFCWGLYADCITGHYYWASLLPLKISVWSSFKCFLFHSS